MKGKLLPWEGQMADDIKGQNSTDGLNKPLAKSPLEEATGLNINEDKEPSGVQESAEIENEQKDAPPAVNLGESLSESTTAAASGMTDLPPIPSTEENPQTASSIEPAEPISPTNTIPNNQPLPEANNEMATTPDPINEKPELPDVPPVENEQPQGDSAEAPDTNEFLQSILGSSQSSSDQSLQEAKSESETIQQTPETPAIPPVELPKQDLAETPQSAETAVISENMVNETTPEQPVIKDATTPVDSLQSSAPKPEIKDEKDENISSKIFSQASPKGKTSSKFIFLVIIIAVILGIGYLLLRDILFKPSEETATATATPAASAVVATEDDLRKADLLTIQDALINYYSASSKYPISAEFVNLTEPQNVLEKEIVPVYLVKLPQDPNQAKFYAYKSDGKTFTLTAVLDNPNDSMAVQEGSLTLLKVTPETLLPKNTPASSTNYSTDTSGITDEELPDDSELEELL